jgi:hypothetical protein
VSAWTRLLRRLVARLIVFLRGEDVVVGGELFDLEGLTISTRCAMAQLDEAANVDPQGHEEERAALLELGAGLDAAQSHHCASALLGDLARARAVVARLQPYEAAARTELETTK